MLPAVYLVVTVTVDRRDVIELVVLMITIEMVQFHKGLRHENESASLATPLLMLESPCQAGWHPWVHPPAHRPVAPVAVIGTCLPPHLGVSDDRHLGVGIENTSPSARKYPALTSIYPPVALGDPVLGFARMPMACPPGETDIELVIELVEDDLADHRPIIVTPTRNHRVQPTDQSALCGRLILADHFGELPIVGLDGLRTRFDERFEALARGRVIPTSGVLTHLKPEEGKPDLSTLRIEGMSDTGFGEMQFKPHVLEPFLS